MTKWAVAAVAILTTAPAWAQAPTVEVTGGTIQGTQSGGVTVFKGIPYAAPPVGELRWRPPAPVVPWTGVRDATEFSADCPQAAYSENSLTGPRGRRARIAST